MYWQNGTNHTRTYTQTCLVFDNISAVREHIDNSMGVDHIIGISDVISTNMSHNLNYAHNIMVRHNIRVINKNDNWNILLIKEALNVKQLHPN